MVDYDDEKIFENQVNRGIILLQYLRWCWSWNVQTVYYMHFQGQTNGKNVFENENSCVNELVLEKKNSPRDRCCLYCSLPRHTATVHDLLWGFPWKWLECQVCSRSFQSCQRSDNSWLVFGGASEWEENNKRWECFWSAAATYFCSLGSALFFFFALPQLKELW